MVVAFKLERRWRKRLEGTWSEAARLAGGRFEPAVRKFFRGTGLVSRRGLAFFWLKRTIW